MRRGGLALGAMGQGARPAAPGGAGGVGLELPSDLEHGLVPHAGIRKEQAVSGDRACGAEALRPPAPEVVASDPPTPPARQVPAGQSPAPYIEAAFGSGTTAEPHEIPLPELSGILVRIITCEAPIHEDEIARRFAHLAGKERTGSRIMARVRQGLRAAAAARTIRQHGPFWTPAAADWKPAIRERSSAAPALQKPDRIADSEIELAIAAVLGSNGGLPIGDIPVAVARLFGFHRTGTELRMRIEAVLTPMLAAGRAVAAEDHVRLAS